MKFISKCISIVVFVFINSYANAQTVPGNLSVNNGGALASNSSLLFSTTTGVLHQRYSASNQNYLGLDFFVNSTTSPRLRITSVGKIGIGSYATPSTKLSFGPFTAGDVSMKLAVADNSINRYGIGYHEEGTGKLLSFFVSEKAYGRFSFFDSYDMNDVRGYEFVSFNAANRSIGINNQTPTSLLHVVGDPAVGNSIYSLAKFQTYATSSGAAHNFINIGNCASSSSCMSINSAYYNGATYTNAPLILNGTGYDGVNYFNGGNVGIGNFVAQQYNVSQPQSKLHVHVGEIQVSGSVTPSSTDPTFTNRIGLLMGSIQNPSSTNLNSYSWIQSSKGPLLLNPIAANSLTDPQTNNYVAIGYTPTGFELPTLPPVGYNLLVKGKVLCEELKIKLKPASGTAWPDYVFASDYKLMSVDSLQNYIAQNNHLPDVPSASEVEENGIMAGEMNAVLLKKIEELTLYMIEQNKNISVQETEIELLKKQNELLQQQLQLLIQQNK